MSTCGQVPSTPSTLTLKRRLYLRKLEELTRSKSSLERAKIELESRVRSLEYSLAEEGERRANAEALHEKGRQLLERKDEQFTA